MKRSKLRAESTKHARRTRAYRKAKPLKDEVCRLCENRPATQRHHVFEQEKFAWMATEPENLEPMCPICHSLITLNGEETYRVLLSELEPERMQRLDFLSTQGKVNQSRMLGR